MIERIIVRGGEVVARALEPMRWFIMMDRTMRRLVDETVAEYQRLAPRRTGRLATSLWTTSPRWGRWIIRVNAPYSAIVEFGSRPHMIYPRHARALRFERGGQVIFASRVRHPGTRGLYVAKRAIEAALTRLVYILYEVVRYV